MNDETSAVPSSGDFGLLLLSRDRFSEPSATTSRVKTRSWTIGGQIK